MSKDNFCGCHEGYYLDNIDFNCIACHMDCKICESKKCLQCKSNARLFKGRCIKNNSGGKGARKKYILHLLEDLTSDYYEEPSL